MSFMSAASGVLNQGSLSTEARQGSSPAPLALMSWGLGADHGLEEEAGRLALFAVLGHHDELARGEGRPLGDVAALVALSNLAPGPHRFSRGSSSSRRPSPSRLKARTVAAMAADGHRTRVTEWSMNSRPEATMRPHEGAGGGGPRPRKLRPDSRRMAKPR